MPAVAEPPHAAAVAARPVAHKVDHKPATAARVVNPWVVTLSVMLATFMEILDTTVVNASIPHISGNLSATVDEGTWTVTSYLVANAIVLPMSGWLANYFGRRRVLMTCVIAGVGLLPAMLSTGIGSQVQKPLATVVVCGMMLAPFVILVTLPALIEMFSRRAAPRAHPEPLAEPVL